MRTIGRHWHTEKAGGDRQAVCAYCSAAWPRSKLVLDMAGNLRCPNEGTGADVVELAQAIANTPQRGRLPDPGGPTPNRTVVGTPTRFIGAPEGAPANYDPWR
jgi:hypothetical protein